MNDLQHMRVVEAVLFAAAAPLSVKKIAQYVPEGTDIMAILTQLADDYRDRGIVLRHMDGFWAFRTHDDVADALQISKDMQKNLSKAAMETLAVIAYHQPITRAEIETIRGVSSSKGTFDILIEAGWIKPGRRRESPGRPGTWVTSPDFLDHFKLESIKDLPGLKDLRDAGLLDPRPALNIIPELSRLNQDSHDDDITGTSGDLFQDDDDPDTKTQ